MTPIKVSVGPLATASANNIALSQTPAGAGPITLNGSTVTGGVAILDTPREILLTTNADETSKTFTVTGTNWSGDVISEVIKGVSSATAKSVLDYKTVTSIVASAATAAAITFGTTTTAGSQWIRFDSWASAAVAMQCVASGTVSYTVQQSMDDPNSAAIPVTPANMTWESSLDTAAVTATGTIATFFQYAPVWARIFLNSGTGSVTATASQAGSVTY